MKTFHYFMNFLIFLVIGSAPITWAFEETLPAHSHRICLGNGEGASGDAEIYIGCVAPGMGIDAGNWVNQKIPSLGRSSQMVSTATDGKRWYMANTSRVDQEIYIGGYNVINDNDAPNKSNWFNTNLVHQMGKTAQGVGLAYDQNRWCISNTTGSSPYKIYIGCTDNLENVGKASSWKNVDISSTLGKSRQAVDLATDGINWAITGTEGGSDKIHVGVMVNPLQDLLSASNWADVNISAQMGKSSTPMDIATDGKRWCIANTTGNSDHEIYIGCTKEQGLDPAVAGNWQNVNLKAIMGKSHSGLSLATDGIVWCMGNTGGADREIYLGCTRPGTDPLVVASWYNNNLKSSVGKSVQGVDVAFYRSCYYPGEEPSSNSSSAPNHGCCEGLAFNSDTNRCELPDFPPDVKEWVKTAGSGCQMNFADGTQITLQEVSRRLRILHLMFAADKPVGLANFTPEQQATYLTDMISFMENSKEYNDIQAGQQKGGAPIEMGDALIEVATYQKETIKSAYTSYKARLKVLDEVMALVVDFTKKDIKTLTQADYDKYAQDVCHKLIIGDEQRLAECINKDSKAPQTLALEIDIQTINNQADFYTNMGNLFTKSQVLFENVTRLAKNETWNCSYSTTMQCGSKRVYDVQEKVFYVNPLFPSHHQAYQKLGIPVTTTYSGNATAYRGTKPIAGDKIPALKAWYESSEFTDHEGAEYREILSMLTKGNAGTEANLPATSEDGSTGAAFEFFQMLTQYRIMTPEELKEEKLPVAVLIPSLWERKIFFRKDLMAYVIDLELMNNFMAEYFGTGTILMANQSSCVDDVKNISTKSTGGGAGLSSSTSMEYEGNANAAPISGIQPEKIVGNESIVANGINGFNLGGTPLGGQVHLGGDNGSGRSGHGATVSSNDATLNAVRKHMKNREGKFLKYKSTNAGKAFAKNVKAGLESYNARLTAAMKSKVMQTAATSAEANHAPITTPETMGSSSGQGSGTYEAESESGEDSGNYGGGNNGLSFGQGQQTMDDNSNPTGLSDVDNENMLSAAKRTDYATNEDDSLFQIISKRYMISGLPRLLIKKKAPTP